MLFLNEHELDGFDLKDSCNRQIHYGRADQAVESYDFS